VSARRRLELRVQARADQRLHSLAIAAGAAGSGYDNFARHYARILARDGVELEVRNSAGAVENLDLLPDAASGAQAALATFGVTQPRDEDILLLMPYSKRLNPVALPPGRARLAT
jgi:hypothetical protein